MCDCQFPKEQEGKYESLVEDLDELLAKGTTLHFKKGQSLCYKDHLPAGIFFLAKGKLTGSPNHEQLLGLKHLLTNTPLCATITALSDVSVVFIPKAILLEKPKGAFCES